MPKARKKNPRESWVVFVQAVKDLVRTQENMDDPTTVDREDEFLEDLAIALEDVAHYSKRAHKALSDYLAATGR